MTDDINGDNEIVEFNRFRRLRVCEECKEEISNNEFHAVFECDHVVHIKCFDEYMKDDRTHCKMCNSVIKYINIHRSDLINIIEPKRFDITEHQKHLIEKYTYDEKYRADIKNLISLRNKSIKLRRTIFNEEDIQNLKDIKSLSKFYYNDIKRLQRNLEKKILLNREYKNYKKFVRNYSSKMWEFERNHGHDFRDYIQAQTNLREMRARGLHIERYTRRMETNPFQYLRMKIYKPHYYFY